MLHAFDTSLTTQCRRRSIPLHRRHYQQIAPTRRLATAAVPTTEIGQQQQRVCSTTTARRRELVQPPGELRGPFSIFNLSHHVSFDNLERSIQLKQAENAWSLFTTLASREGERYIPLPLCSALYSLLTFAKTLSGHGKVSAYRQKQIDELLSYVEEEFEMPRSQFMAGAQVIPIPAYKLLMRAIKRQNRRTAWAIFYDMANDADAIAEIPRGAIFKLMSLIQDDLKLDAREKIYHLFATDDSRAAHGMMMQMDKDMSSSVLAELVWRSVEFKAVKAARELLFSVQARRKERNKAVGPDEAAYISLMNTYRDQKMYTKALEIFEWLLRDGVPPSIHAFNAALNVFADQGEIDKAKYMFESLTQMGIMPDSATFSELIKVHTATGDVRSAIEYYHMMREKYEIQPNLYAYSLIIDAFAKRNDVRSVIRWFQSMLRHDVTPNHIIINNVLKAFKRQSKRHPNMGEAVMRIAAQARAAGVKADAALYTVLLQVQAQINGLSGALSTHREMLDRLIEPNVYTYTVLIHTCGMFDAPDAAERIFELMKQSQHPPTTVTYCAMMDVLSKAQQHRQLRDLVREFQAKSEMDRDGRLQIDAKVRGYIQLYS
ncbi:hypothetical protein BJV82DRAFT_521646 [Fennellomyces sp. T-0311]|nr:hypothetical protein BJV82DRAFT_521646 [Fennellomyces sp. T-0311]